MGDGIIGNRLGVVTTPSTGSSAVDSLLFNVKWAVGADRTISYSFAGANGRYSWGSDYPDPEVSNASKPSASFQANVTSALATWSAVANINFALVPDTLAGAGDIRMFLVDSGRDGANAFAKNVFDTTGTAAPGDVFFLRDFFYETSPGSYNYKTMVHEIGHALGLKHPGDYNATGGSNPGPYIDKAFDNSAYSVMAYDKSINVLGNLSGPGLFDILAIQYLYGANMNYAKGDQVYDISSSNFKTIWDPNGVNTLSGATGIATQYISAQEFSFSSIRSYFTAAVAQGTKISNLIGGYGDDTLIGNALNNRFTGGQGNDTIIGNGGVDTAVYSANRSNYTVTRSSDSYIVKGPLFNGDGTDKLTGVTYLAFADVLLTVDAAAGGTPPTIIPTNPTVASNPAVAAAYPTGVAIADQLAVVYLGRGISANWRDATAPLVNSGAAQDMLQAFFTAAVKDRVFSARDSAQLVANQTFVNIFGVYASQFEQNAWAKLVSDGVLSREALPWAMFNSYLGATNVPPSNQIPAQSRIIAAHAFTDAIDSSLADPLGDPGASGAELARSWLLPIRNQTDAAAKVVSASSFVSTNFAGAVPPTIIRTNPGPLEGAAIIPDSTALLPLSGVSDPGAFSFGPSGALM